MVLSYKIIIDNRAWIDLGEILNYYELILERPDLVPKVIKQILEKINALKILIDIFPPHRCPRF